MYGVRRRGNPAEFLASKLGDSRPDLRMTIPNCQASFTDEGHLMGLRHASEAVEAAVAPGGGWQDNKAVEAYTNFNKLPIVLRSLSAV